VLRQVDARVVQADDWAEGMGASLRAGLAHLSSAGAADAAVVCVVDTPGLTAAVVRRVVAHARRDALARATYGGAPGHPVLLGAEHFAGLLETTGGDVGARDYLRRHPPVEVECADLAAGSDVDTPGDLPPGHRLG
jgi:CTP:molybdopterin cytidylyltransferase MocA